jgi:chemosensory pili system protein ChpA (sensor histidine kinase/response regulator)
MDEAIDYNALSWVRQELEATLKHARVQLEEYAAGADNKTLLQKCAAQLHEALGPLQMVGIKGAVLLTSEMEEVTADLLQDSIKEKETALELLMQAFLQLPDYLSSIRSGRKDNPAVLLPVINSLRATRGVQPLQETAVFSPNLSVRVPASVFDVRARKEKQDIPAIARAARVRFQGGLLAWYRGNDGNTSLQTLVDVLVQLQQSALSEPVARVWWVGAGLAEALRDGELEETTEIKQLFGQLDRQIKRLMDSGEKVFSDLLTDDLVKNLLYRISQCSSGSRRITTIKSTYGLDDIPVNSEANGPASEGAIVFNDDLLQTVAVTIRTDIENIKEHLDAYTRNGNTDVQVLAPVADGLHILGNTLDMISKEELGKTVFVHEQHIRDLIAGNSGPADSVFSEIANTLITIEDTLDDVAANDPENAAFNQGIEAVSREVLASMSRAKEIIHEFLKAPEKSGPLDGVPELLEQMSGGLQLINEERAAAITGKVRLFVLRELIERHKKLTADQLDTFADAMCSIEFHVEETCENRGNTGSALDIAAQSMKKLGYPCPVAARPGYEDTAEAGQDSVPAGGAAAFEQPGTDPVEPVRTAAPEMVDNSPDIAGLQVIAADVDEEILSIFIEEADEELVKLKALVPSWVNCPDLQDYLVDAQRSFHTLKGSGRMVGAMAIGEFAWAFESLVNRIIEGVVTPHDDIRALIARSPDALSGMVEQVKGNPVDAGQDVNRLAHCALVYSDPDGVPESLAVEQDVVPEGIVEEAAVEQEAPVDLPVLSADADPEIVEIFLEEAAEEIAKISVAIPGWVNQPDDEEALATVRRSMHTLKGSGRMAGAMLVGEFSWSIENLLNRVIEGTVSVNDQMFVLLGQLPEALSRLITQVQGDAAPAVDVSSFMRHADALGRGEVIEISKAEPDQTAVEETESGSEVTDAGNQADLDDAVLIDIFRNECFGHLQALDDFLAAGDKPREVTESLYRALHTLSGISESADVVSIRLLAADLNGYVDEVYQSQQVLGQEAMGVLRDSNLELRQLIGKLPDQAFDEISQGALRERIAGLPRTTEEPGPEAGYEGRDEISGQQFAAVAESATAAADEDPYASMDQELYEIFIEEASEIIDNSESVLRAWSEERDNHAHLEEFQRHLHTLKGSSRMLDIPAIGDLAHVLESLLTRVADGQVANSDDLFTLLHESHDRLSEMLENVKSRRFPGEAENLETALKVMAQEEAGTTGTETETEAMAPAEAEDTVDAPETVIGAGQEAAGAADTEPEIVDETETADTAGIESEAADAAVVEARVETTETEPAAETVTPEAETAEAAPESGDVAVAGSPGEQTPAVVEPADTPVTVDVQPENEPAVTPPVRKAAALPVKAERRKIRKVRSEQVRVQSELLDDLVNHAGEISIYRTRMEKQVGDYRFNLTELGQTIARLRDQLRQLEMETEAQILFRYEQEADTDNQDFDPLEMDRYSNLQQTSRSLIESISDLRSLQELMETTTREAETLMLQQSRVTTDLQEGLMHTRMIPFSGLGSRLRRIVRQSARQLGKKVELDLVGADGEMDRTVIERIIAPLEHMLRNAIAHGIEKPSQRSEAGKQEAGSITISFDREGPEIVLRIEDDGAGIDIEAVRARAIERDLIPEDSPLPDNDIMQFILQTGFSTATEVTQISGRGVGLDVVNSEVKQLGGSLHIESTPGLGTLFTVRLPYTLAINQALLVAAGEQTFCVPLGSVEGVVRANPEELLRSYSTEECVYDYAGNEYQLRHLGTVLETGNMDLGRSQGQVPVLLVRIGEKRIAFQVESLKGSREIVIKPVGVQFSAVDSISGATILGDGSVVMILDMAAVARINTRMHSPDLPAIQKTESRLLVMVVDDSITVRKVTTRLLERNGFKVLTAKDGVDAMGQLQETVPDMMLLDIEMPRMDGFELATHMRNDDRFKHVPIIMITSRTGDKHRERARQIGVNNYLGKPYQENDLLYSIHHIIGATETGAVA